MKAFFGGGAFFAALCLVAKGIGALYRIPLTNIMGAEGIGLYQMVFPLYSVLLTVSGGGLPGAISKTVSAFSAVGDTENTRRTLKISLLVLTLAGLAATVLLIVFRDKIAALQGNPLAATAYLGIAPAVAFVAVISCFRGYFQGKLDMLPSGISQVVEQVVKMVVGLILCSRFLQYGVAYAAFGALLGVTVSEMAATAVLLVQYAFDTVRFRKRNIVSLGKFASEQSAELCVEQAAPLPYKTLLKKVLAVAFPITLGSLVLPLSSVIDSILVINLLTAMGESTSQATRFYGILNGPVGSLVNMPTVITTSLSVLLLPKISRIVLKKKDAGEIAEKFIRISLLIAVPCALALILFSDEILSVLYRRTLSADLLNVGGTLLRISALSVLYMSLLQPAAAVLQGCDRAYKPAVNLLKGAVLKAALTVILIRVAGIYGASIATVSCFALTCILNVSAMRKCAETNLDLPRLFKSALVAGTAFVATGKLLYLLFKSFLPASVALIAALALAAAAYLAATALLKGVKREELALFVDAKKDG